MTNAELKKTPLFAHHQKYGGRMVPFAGWHMPVQFKGIIEEHQTVRQKAGLFDVSHMGEIRIQGKDALAAVQFLTSNNAALLQPGQAQYSLLCTEAGTLVDDIIVYALGENHFFICVNAGNTDKDFAWMTEHIRQKRFDVACTNESSQWGQLALQGPVVKILAEKYFSARVANLAPFHFVEETLYGVPCILARTGYTGEFGYEIFIPWEKTAQVFEKIMAVGSPLGLAPIGLGARDTLRLEMKYPLYGNDLDEQHTALEAGLGWVVKLDKGEFLGRTALASEKARGSTRKWVGLHMLERGIPRHGYTVFAGETAIGEVTSGTHSPSLDLPIGTAYLQSQFSAVDTEIAIDIRGTKVKARVVKTPFLKRG